MSVCSRIFECYKGKQQYIRDIILNIVATAVPLLVLQFLVLPGVNAQIGDESYGLVVTLVGVFTLVTSTAAGTLNNVRLLMDEQYQESGICGDFNIIQGAFSLLTAVIVIIVGGLYIGRADLAELCGLALVTILICADGYYSVGFRLQINYKRILVQKILLSIGYYLGYRLFLTTDNWIWVYLMGYIVELPYVLLKTNLIREPWRKTKLFPVTAKKEGILMASSIIGGLSSHVDKLILYPLLGGVITSTYYVATLMGKGISLATFPISGVLLSYFAKVKELGKNTVKGMTIFGWTAGIFGYVFCLLVARPLLGYLYPTLVNEALVYLPVTLFGAVIGVQNTMLSPVVLKYCDTRWQIVISTVNVVGYLVIALTLLKLYGVMGFCIGGTLTALLKYFIYVGVYLKEKKKDRA